MFGLDIVNGECYSSVINTEKDNRSYIRSFDFIGNLNECLNFLKNKEYSSIYGPLKDCI